MVVVRITEKQWESLMRCVQQNFKRDHSIINKGVTAGYNAPDRSMLHYITTHPVKNLPLQRLRCGLSSKSFKQQL